MRAATGVDELINDMHAALKSAERLIAEELVVLDRSYLPNANESEAEEIKVATSVLTAIRSAIAKAEGRTK